MSTIKAVEKAGSGIEYLKEAEKVTNINQKILIRKAAVKYLFDGYLEGRKLLSALPDEMEYLGELSEGCVCIENVTDMGVKIDMPCLLPELRATGYSDEKEFVKSILFPAVKRFCNDGRNHMINGDATVAFIHYYDQEEYAFDCDSLSRKCALDVISPFFLLNDGVGLDHFIALKKGDDVFTRIYILPRDDFKQLYNEGKIE